MRCKKCGKPIEFILMRNGKKMPVDAEKTYLRADVNGPIKGVMPNGRLFDAVFSAPNQPGAVKAFMTHWPNCAKGITRGAKMTQDEWRKRQDEQKQARLQKSHINHPHGNPYAPKPPEKKSEQIALF